VGFKGRYLCDFLLVAAMNPCPCGYLGDPAHACRCTQTQIQRYLSKISGPLLDRIDIHIRMGSVDESELGLDSGSRECLSTAQMRRVALAARERGQNRNPGKAPNARLSADGAGQVCAMEKDAEKLLKQAYDHFSFSVRVRSKLIRIARTIADMAGEDMIRAEHIAEAIAYRAVGRTE